MLKTMDDLGMLATAAIGRRMKGATTHERGETSGNQTESFRNPMGKHDSENWGRGMKENWEGGKSRRYELKYCSTHHVCSNNDPP